MAKFDFEQAWQCYLGCRKGISHSQLSHLQGSFSEQPRSVPRDMYSHFYRRPTVPQLGIPHPSVSLLECDLGIRLQDTRTFCIAP